MNKENVDNNKEKFRFNSIDIEMEDDVSYHREFLNDKKEYLTKYLFDKNYGNNT